MTSTAAANVLAVYTRATADEITNGTNWYQTAHDIATLIAPTVEAGAGVIAALSPMMGWDRNVMLATKAFADGHASGALSRNVAKADAIMAGAAPLDVLGGKKVRSFYSNILDPAGTHVTIDRHAFDIVAGRVTTDKEKGTLSNKGVYEAHEAAYVEAGEILGLTGSQMQAITWVTWRREKGIA